MWRVIAGHKVALAVLCVSQFVSIHAWPWFCWLEAGLEMVIKEYKFRIGIERWQVYYCCSAKCLT